MKNNFTYVYKEKGKLWIEGIRRYRIPLWASKIPNGFEGFVEIFENEVILYKKDWHVHKSYKVPGRKS